MPKPRIASESLFPPSAKSETIRTCLRSSEVIRAKITFSGGADSAGRGRTRRQWDYGKLRQVTVSYAKFACQPEYAFNLIRLQLL